MPAPSFAVAYQTIPLPKNRPVHLQNLTLETLL
jgi:hypothetical protein